MYQVPVETRAQLEFKKKKLLLLLFFFTRLSTVFNSFASSFHLVERRFGALDGSARVEREVIARACGRRARHAHATMVPEVLLALLGVPGEVIVLVPPADGCPERFRVSPDLPFLEPPERVSLDRLVSLGYAFRCLEAFVSRENEAGTLAAVGSTSGGGGGGGSLYRRALAAGVSEVLGSYEAAILRLEQDILRGVTPAMPAALESALSGFALVLPALHATLRPVIESDGEKRRERARVQHHATPTFPRTSPPFATKNMNTQHTQILPKKRKKQNVKAPTFLFAFSLNLLSKRPTDPPSQSSEAPRCCTTSTPPPSPPARPSSNPPCAP